METGKTSITSAASINFQSFATVNNWGTWTMTSLARWTVSMNINGFTFTNAGTVVWTSNGNMQISHIRPLVNAGDFTLKSAVRASYSYGQITNIGNMKMLSKASTDTISVSNAFSNSGYFAYEYGLNSIYACLFMSLITNSGIMNIYGSTGLSVMRMESTVSNIGSICLKRTKYTLGSSITGLGCWMLAESSTMNLATTVYPMATTQSIVFQDTTGSIILSYLDTSNVYTLYRY